MAAVAAASPCFPAAAASCSSTYAATCPPSCSSSFSPPVWSRGSEVPQQAWCSAGSSFFRSARPRNKTFSRLRCSPKPCAGVAFASAEEPKWKQKLAAADQHAEQTRQQTMQAQEDYRKRQDALRKQQQGEAGDLTSLQDLKFIPYLTEEGLVTDCSSPDAKATVYAIFGEDQTLHYIGISRQVAPSLRLHFARVPMKCFYIKLKHVTKPNRALLESIKDQWISENGKQPDGNDNGEQQNIWENPLDCKPLMLENERQLLQEAAPGPPTGKVLKDVARRIERDLEASFKLRNCKEKLRFDPKLKEKGLLDVKNTPPRMPSKQVPATDLRAGAASTVVTA